MLALLKLDMLTLGVFIFTDTWKNSLFVIIPSSQDSGVSPWGLITGQTVEVGLMLSSSPPSALILRSLDHVCALDFTWGELLFFTQIGPDRILRTALPEMQLNPGGNARGSAHESIRECYMVLLKEQGLCREQELELKVLSSRAQCVPFLSLGSLIFM